MRVNVGGSSHAQTLQQIQCAGLFLLLGQAADAKADVFQNSQVRKERRLLEGKADISFFGRHLDAAGCRDKRPAQKHLATGGHLKPCCNA